MFKRCVVIKKSVEGWTLHRTNTAQEGKVEIKFSGFHGCWFDYPPEPEPLRVLSVKDGKLKVSMPSTVFATR